MCLLNQCYFEVMGYRLNEYFSFVYRVDPLNICTADIYILKGAIERLISAHPSLTTSEIVLQLKWVFLNQDYSEKTIFAIPMLRKCRKYECILMFPDIYLARQGLSEEQMSVQSRGRLHHKLCRSWWSQRALAGRWYIMYITLGEKYEISDITNIYVDIMITRKTLWREK